MAVEFRRRREKFVANPELQREIRANSPIVAGIAGGPPTAKIAARISEAHVGGVGEAEQKIGKVKTRAANGLAVGANLRSEQAAEGKQAFRRLVRGAVVFDAADF